MNRILTFIFLGMLPLLHMAQLNRTYLQIMPSQSFINGSALLPEPDGTVSYSQSAMFVSWMANDSNLMRPNGVIPAGYQAVDQWEGSGNHPYRLHWDPSDSAIYGSGPYEHNPSGTADSDIGFVLEANPGRTSIRYASLAFPGLAGYSKLWNVRKQDSRYYAAGFGTDITGQHAIIVCLDDTLQLVWAKVYRGIRQFKDIFPTNDGRLFAVGEDVVLRADLSGNTVWIKRYDYMYDMVSIEQLDQDRFAMIGADTIRNMIHLLEIHDNGNMYRAKYFNLQGGLGGIHVAKMIPGFNNSLCLTGYGTSNNSDWNVWVMNIDTVGTYNWAITYHVGTSDCVYDLVTTANCNYANLGTYYDGSNGTTIGTLLTRIQSDGRIMNPISLNGWISGPVSSPAAPIAVAGLDSALTTPLSITTTVPNHIPVVVSGFFVMTMMDTTQLGCGLLQVDVHPGVVATHSPSWRTDHHTWLEVLPTARVLAEPLHWEVVGMNGQAVASGTWANDAQLRISLEGFASGIYVLRWKEIADWKPIKVLKF